MHFRASPSMCDGLIQVIRCEGLAVFAAKLEQSRLDILDGFRDKGGVETVAQEHHRRRRFLTGPWQWEKRRGRFKGEYNIKKKPDRILPLLIGIGESDKFSYYNLRNLEFLLTFRTWYWNLFYWHKTTKLNVRTTADAHPNSPKINLFADSTTFQSRHNFTEELNFENGEHRNSFGPSGDLFQGSDHRIRSV